jgi:hypothetical protein
LAVFYPRIRAALTPVIVTTCAVMALSGVYLVYAGFLTILWPVALTLFLSTLFFPLLLIPAALFAGLLQLFTVRKKPRIAMVMQILSAAWLVGVMSVSGMLVFDVTSPALAAAGAVTHAAALAWCVAGTVAPWAVFARGDRDNLFFTCLVMMLLAGTLAAAATGGGFMVIAGVMGTLVAAQAVYEETVLKKKLGKS